MTEQSCPEHPEETYADCPICYEAFILDLLEHPGDDEDDGGVADPDGAEDDDPDPLDDVADPVADPPEFCELHPSERWAECQTCRDMSLTEDMEIEWLRSREIDPTKVPETEDRV
jgi:hypothetical protein